MTEPGLDVMMLLGTRGKRWYGEGLSQLEHALQCAALARRQRADDEVVLAALLHDIGHLVAPGPVREEPGRHHGHEGAALLRPFVSPRVAWLVEHHVAAKRYLCAVDLRYAQRLSAASARSLVAQGGPLAPDERQALESHPWFAEAILIRQWDEAGKDPALSVPPLGDYGKLLERHFGPQTVGMG